MFTKENCKYSHGIADLEFKKYNDEIIDFDGKLKDYNQKALWRESKPNYVNIFED